MQHPMPVIRSIRSIHCSVRNRSRPKRRSSGEQDSLTKLTRPRTLEDLFQRRESGQLPELNLIIRADVQGSVDALLQTLGDLPSDQVKLNILHTGIGSISESDVVLAEASGRSWWAST